MDFGVVGLDGFVSSEAGFDSLASDPESKQKSYVSALRFRSVSNEHDSRSSKLAKTDDFSSSKTRLLRSKNVFSFSDAQEHERMLSFSSPKSQSIPYFHSTSASPRNTGYNNGSLNSGSMYGAGIRGPFTPSQWMELEHQALIYKYIAANVAVPSNLLMPIKKALDSAGFSSFPAAFLRPNALGWGTFHMGFSGSSDPEPGRCRRTDGKKWRCSRYAEADQKYCERHMNRGRHRSRKPVEGQAGHSIAGVSTINTTSKLVSSPAVSMVVAGAGAPNKHLKNFPPAPFHASISTHPNRLLMEKDNGDRLQNESCFSALSSPEITPKSKQTSFLVPKQQISYEVSPRAGAEFGLVSADFLLNPSSHTMEGETESRLHHFIWPKNQSDRSVVPWPGFDRTQLSKSTSMSSSSVTNENLTLSPLRMSRDFDPIQMRLGSREANWIPLSRESSMGGPLGEVLKHTSNNVGEKSPSIGSSPTGVLQKSSFGSVSTSSTGSSPRAENNPSLDCNDLLGQLL